MLPRATRLNAKPSGGQESGMTLLVFFILYAVGLSVGLARNGHRSPRAPRSPEAAPLNPTRVLIVGATGGTGRQLVAQALERGLAVTALVRNPSDLRVEHRRLTVVQGDVLDAASVEVAMRGQEAVISALGHKRYFYPTRILSEGTANILRAMETHRVRRLVCETSLGIGDSAGRMGVYYTFFVIPLILPLYFWDKTRQESVIAASNVDWVIVRPGALTNGARRGRLRHGRRVGSFLWTVRVPRADVAGFMLDQLASNSYVRAAPGVA
jgi:putative NADH-flavin reductase